MKTGRIYARLCIFSELACLYLNILTMAQLMYLITETSLCSARIVPNEVGVRLPLLRNLYGWGAWMWRGQMIFVWRGGGQLKRWGVESPGPQQFEQCLCESCDVHEKHLLVLNNHLHYSVVLKLQILQF